jgi:hypothetical protein
MKKLIRAGLLLSFLAAPQANAECAVDDGTFYAQEKQWMTAFAAYIGNEELDNALSMVDDGRVKSVTRATAFVLERDDPLVHTHIMGIGKVWILDAYINCR